jgi:hypothetical protein
MEKETAVPQFGDDSYRYKRANAPGKIPQGARVAPQRCPILLTGKSP